MLSCPILGVLVPRPQERKVRIILQQIVIETVPQYCKRHVKQCYQKDAEIDQARNGGYCHPMREFMRPIYIGEFQYADSEN